MNRFYVLLFSVFSSLAFGQQRYVDYVFAGDEIKVIEDEIYVSLEQQSYLNSYLKDADWVARLCDKHPKWRERFDRLYVKDLRADVYLPEVDYVVQRPMVVLLHGGGFMMGTKKDLSIVKLCKELARRGYVTASINYRLMAIDYPSLLKAGYMATQDGKAAIRYFKAHANEYGIDPNRIFVGGISAGAVTALHVAFLDDGEGLAERTIAFDDMLGCLDCVGDYQNFDASVAGVINIGGGLIHPEIINETVPVISFHGQRDKIVSSTMDIPFQPLMGKYNQSLDKVNDLWSEVKILFAIRSRSDAPNHLKKAKMPPLYGSEPLHQQLDFLGIHNELVLFEELDHNLTLSEVGVERRSGREVIEGVVGFLNENQ